MTVCLNNPVLGREITDNFTFDDANNQIVPKPGTDTKPGALALNLGNATGDTTNATDALTAAGFNAMANAVDSTAPLCGNEIQQAVAVAVGQSIACDAASQQAIACAIASNPDAVACLKAVLGSSSTSGKYYVATSSQQDYSGNTNLIGNCYLVNNGVVTNLTPSGLTPHWLLNDVNKDNPVAYYRNGSITPGSAASTVITQVVMSDTGVTETAYSLADVVPFPGQVTRNFHRRVERVFYDTVTKHLYARYIFSGNDDDGSAFSNTGILRIQLNAAGMITGAAPISTTLNTTPDTSLEMAANGVGVLNGGSKMLNLSTDAITTMTNNTGSYGNLRTLDISPDGTKWAHASGQDGFGGTINIRSTANNALISVVTSGQPMDSQLAGGAFFTLDSQHLIASGERLAPNQTNGFKIGLGHRSFAVATGQYEPNLILMEPTFSASGGAGYDTIQHIASNNAICILGVAYSTIGEVRILENKNDVWTEVARLPGIYNRAGFYLVSP